MLVDIPVLGAITVTVAVVVESASALRSVVR